ncbi:hypothetical protein M409DRAFT_70538 [Zasmidium cellare ATCC 36951]|uniref:Major facilitator superfamily (MFS) profile domain-containing protein n=1 Tax=Zasmidium cellare ATCC 36951 TaxID=1080233 RepID=A0A6A6C010_ZASCE|nr:uncharacterized protein M409DRAFT_70538 [Zasmidium cellare ATCC 36951]KAF2160387.1 hypothetical protein M409DRAFT_70538 [Zasmidium cellare ATCC 36951]
MEAGSEPSESIHDEKQVDASAESQLSAQEEKAASEFNFRSIGVLCAGSLGLFVTVGFMNAYGVFQQYYTAHYLPNESNFQISWIGSFASFACFAFAAPAGFLTDRTGPTVPIAIGSVCEIVAVFMVSLSRKYYQFFLSQGVLLGIGMSMIAIPVTVVIPMHFKKHRALAQGCTIAGSSLGGVIWPIALDQLLNKDGISFGWSLRIVGFTMIPLCAVVILCTQKPQKKKKDLSGLKHPSYILLCAGLAFSFFGFFSPLFFVTTYGVSLGISESTSFYLLSALNAASLFGRILPGIVADKLGPFNVLVCATFGSAIVTFCWTAATSLAGLIVWSIAYGFISGAILSLQLVCATTLTTDESHGAGVGMVMASVSLTGLFGTPIAGELVKGGYLALSCFAAATLLVGGVLLGLARLAKDKRLLVKV